jgi:ATP-dependent DNA helicase RecQ
MLYSFQDKFIQEFFIDNSYPSKETVKEVYEYLCSIPGDPIETTLQEIKDDLDLSIGTAGIATCENLLEKAGAIERLDSKQNSAAIKIDSDLPTLIDLLPRDARTQRHVMRELERIVSGFRGERVMFQPQRLADRLEMKWEAVNRAIRQLRKIPMIDYIPPFRGRAIHIVDRKRKFSDLKIDFAELHRRQKSEHEKLNSVIRLATTRRCRQLEILEYFGDADRKLCGTCDNCQKRPQLKIGTAKHSDEDACLYSAQVALSGTARTHGRIGKTLIAQMLTGSASKKIKQLSLDRLSTFALLKGLRQADVVLLMEFLIHQGFITQTETTKFRPVLAISPTGRKLMAGEFPLELTTLMPGDLVEALSLKFQGKIPRRTAPASTNTKELEPIAIPQETTTSESPPRPATTPDLFESVETQPEASAKKQTLALEPTSSSQSKVPSEKGEQVQPDLSKLRLDRPEPHSVQPNFFWTWRLLADGYSMDHLRQVRQIDEETIFSHVLRATENNLPVQAEWLLSDEKIATLNKLISQHPSDRTSKLISKLPSDCLPQELVYFLKCQTAS